MAGSPRGSARSVLGSVRSVNVGRARTVEWRGREWRTGIFKDPVDGPVRMEGVQLAGDEQADPSVHGGPTKSVYAYPFEHYRFWREALPPRPREVLDLPGAFGENLTTEGILETEIGVGDLLRVGGAVLRATEPRMPCAKLGLRFQDARMTRRFHRARRNGIYFAIEEAGDVRAGDPILLVARHPVRLTIQEVVDLETGAPVSPDVRARAVDHPALSHAWREHFKALPS